MYFVKKQHNLAGYIKKLYIIVHHDQGDNFINETHLT